MIRKLPSDPTALGDTMPRPLPDMSMQTTVAQLAPDATQALNGPCRRGYLRRFCGLPVKNPIKSLIMPSVSVFGSVASKPPPSARTAFQARRAGLLKPCWLAQIDLFGDGRRTLVDDDSGRIEYVPGAVPPAQAAQWFAALSTAIPWSMQRRRMYDRDVDVPRLTASFRLDDADLPPVLSQAAEKARELAGVPFTSVGLNLYRDGDDSVAPHNDHLYEISAGFPIALLSLGATRRMTIRSKDRPRRIFDLDLENGSFLIMSYETQKRYDHGIPKTKLPMAPRISAAFRVRPK
jgi:alkylated DNA repair dioxygenase AlkB